MSRMMVVGAVYVGFALDTPFSFAATAGDCFAEEAWPLVVGCLLARGTGFLGSNVGSKTGRSGCIVVARVSRVTSRPGGSVEKYFCLCRRVVSKQARAQQVNQLTSSAGAPAPEMKARTSSSGTGSILSLSQGLQYHSLSTSSITLWSIGG